MISKDTKKFLELKKIRGNHCTANNAVNGVIYARISDEDKDSETSISRQIERAMEYAKENQITITQTYSEEKSSMCLERREEFNKMIKHVFSAGSDIDVVICLNYSRFGRDVEEMKGFQKKFRKAGKRILSVQEDFGDDANGRCLENIIFAFNENHVVRAADDTYECERKIAESGGVTGEVPYGFAIKKLGKQKRYVLDKIQAPVVEYIFQSVANGLSYSTIQAHLKEQGIKTKRGCHFSKGYINTILKNVKYKGCMLYCRSDGNSLQRNGRVTLLDYGEIRVENVLPKIVTDELFDEVQAILAKRNKGSHESIGLDGKYILKGKIYCSCGKQLHGTVKQDTRTKKQTEYYHCPHHKKSALFDYCSVKDIKKDLVESLVFDIIDKALNSSPVMGEIIAKLAEKKLALSRAIEKTKGRIAIQEETHSNYMDRLAENWGAKEMQKLRQRVEDCNSEIERLTGVLNQQEINLERLSKLGFEGVQTQKSSTYSNSNKRRLVERLVESVVVDSQSVKITLRT